MDPVANWLELDERSRWGSSNGIIHAKTPLVKATEKLGLLQPQEVKRWTAIGTYEGPYWNRVKHGTAWKDVPALTQFLIWEQNDGGYGILLPLLCGDYVTTLQGEKNGVRLIATTGRNSERAADPAVAFSATGRKIDELVGQSLRAVAAHARSFRLREDKKVPAFVDYLGWCSWDAFYSKVDEGKFLAALRSFRKGGIQPGFVILDDGWLDNKGDLLCGFEMNGEKFPSGLAGLVRQTKEELGVKFFGIWHAFNGYWGGIDPKSALGKKYDVLKSSGLIRPWAGDKRDDLYLVDPRQAPEFFTEFHDILKAGGVDLVKVDGQSALTEFTRPHFWPGFVDALLSTGAANFGGEEFRWRSDSLHEQWAGCRVSTRADGAVAELGRFLSEEDFLGAANSCAHERAE